MEKTLEEYYESLTTNRRNFAIQLSNIIINQLKKHKNQESNFDSVIKTIAIDASFGMGKSHFAKGLNYSLTEVIKVQTGTKIEVIEYNAWESDFFQDPMKTILYKLLNNVHNDDKIDIETRKMFSNTLKILGEDNSSIPVSTVSLPIFKIVNILKNHGIIEDLNDYKNYLELIENVKKIVQATSNLRENEYKPKVIIVDELDRCRPNFSVEVLEAIKHFFNLRGLIFVFLINKEQLTESVKSIYGDVQGSNESYFKKFFDLEFKLPEIEIKEFIKEEFKTEFPENKLYTLYDDTYVADLDLWAARLFTIFYEAHHKFLQLSARQFLKLKNKFELLLSSIDEEEKESVFFIHVLIYEFLKKEKMNKEIGKPFFDVLARYHIEGNEGYLHFHYNSSRIKVSFKSKDIYNADLSTSESHSLFTSLSRYETNIIAFDTLVTFDNNFDAFKHNSKKIANLRLFDINNGEPQLYISKKTLTNLSLGEINKACHTKLELLHILDNKHN